MSPIETIDKGIAAHFKTDDQGREIVYPFGHWGGGYLLPDKEAKERMFSRFVEYSAIFLFVYLILIFVLLAFMFVNKNFLQDETLALVLILMISYWMVPIIYARVIVQGLQRVAPRPRLGFLYEDMAASDLSRIASYVALVGFLLFLLCDIESSIVKLILLLASINLVYQSAVSYLALKAKRQRGETEEQGFVLEISQRNAEKKSKS